MSFNSRSIIAAMATFACCMAPSANTSADVFNMNGGLKSLELVTIGNPGNPADTEVMTDDTTGYGSVPYAYRIGKFEVTVGQYVEFLNKVAASDPFGLYNTEMWNSEVASKIERHGSLGSYTYTAASDRVNRPVDFISFWDALRFTNWLHNGQPTGGETSLTTENGAYTLNGYTGTSGITIHRNANAKYWLPTENEWYKAAYYDPIAGHYWDYPTGSDVLPSNDLPDVGNNANYQIYKTEFPLDYTIGEPYWRTEVGTFSQSESPYGTYDQGGNVFEWNDTLYAPSLPGFADRVFRGGSWLDFPDGLWSRIRYYPQMPTFESYVSGFRIATTIPETSTIVLAICACLGCALSRPGTARNRKG